MPLNDVNPGSVKYYNNDTVYDFITHRNRGLSLTSLYHVKFSTPKVFKQNATDHRWKNFDHDDTERFLNIYASAINMPSKQLMTGQVVDFGTPRKFATGVGFGSCNMTFQMPRNQFIRAFFEQWMNAIVADSNNMVEDYNNYVCKRIRIYKLERGQAFQDNKPAYQNPAYSSGTNTGMNNKKKDFRLNSVVGCVELRNVFPQNIGTTQLSQRDARLNTMTVGFNYERYRFYSNPGPAGFFLDNVVDTDGKSSKNVDKNW